MADKMKDTKHMCDIYDMVCPDENNQVKTSITVLDTTPGTTQKKINFVVRPTLAVSDIFTYVDTQYPYVIYDLSLQPETGDKEEPTLIYLNNKKDKPLADIPGFNAGTKNTVLLSQVAWDVGGGVGVVPSHAVKKVDLDSTISPLTPELDMLSEDEDLGLGASASPVEPNSTSTIPIAPALPMFDPIEPAHGSYKPFKIYSPPRPAGGYVGLVNQAMTCYLNSLLQALFMTPEFRNALYKWEFDNIEEAKSIPYQLQKLFLNLQTSPKVAVETTDLTRSFGWDSTEAWQQHDIQELCRVMFDALERKFKDTEQANLINNLYEGKMIDYVKCLDCCTEKSREDTFLDIPLPVRPFSSLVAYGSIEEALRAFVQPETLDGNNQYFCEKCNKKCDAHKGLKFKTFPYILTLHLKRFDFDYQTLHRIKLNDKVTFPQTLNLNSFVNVTDAGTFANLQNNNHAQTNGFASSASSEHDANESTAKYDDCSTTDSGAALEDDNSSGIATTASSSHHENELQEDDEGIDMSTNTENRNHASNESGPYLYELFAIMIHSGSASGGHYYAYIKDFESGEWYCFNDQTVSTITQEDIQKSFGGGSFKAYYSGVYSSSTNAYMLMYRQIEPKRNERAIKANEFPEHIQTLLQKLHDKDEEDKRVKASEPEFIKLKVYFCNPKLKKLKDVKVFISKCHPFKSALETAHNVLNMENFAPISRCRLVAYDHQSKEIVRSFEGMENESVGNILKILQPDTDFLMEMRGENEEFEVYEAGTVTMKVFKVDMKTYDVDGPFLIRTVLTMSVPDFKKLLAKKLDLKEGNITVVSSTICSGILVLRNSNTLYPRSKIFVACDSKPVDETEEGLKRVAEESFIHINYFYLSVPPTDKETLEILNIPKYESKVGYDESNYQTPKQSPSEFKSFGMTDVVDAVMINGTVNGEQGSGDFLRTSPVLVSMGHESNSEDSSLSDGDRTLVEIPRHDSSQMSSTSQSPQLSSPEDENGEKHGPMLPHDVASDDEVEMEIDSELYFRAVEVNDSDITPYILTNGNISDSEDSKEKSQPHKTLKLIVDKRMKIGSLKRALEPLIGVPAEYFKIVRKQSDSLKLECTNLSENLITFKEGEQLRIELGRNLKKGEYKAKIHYLKLSELNDEVGKLSVICDWIFKVGMPITDAKKELVAQLHKIDPKYKSLTVENCRLWEKSGRNPVKIFSDDQQMGSDMRLSMNYEMIVQECENGVSTSTNEESLTIFVRRWRPSTLELGPFEEITLEKNDEIKKFLSSISDIPEDKVAYSKVNNCVFPCTNMSLLTIQSSMQWYTNLATTENYPLNTTQNGSVYFYKNSTELPKDLTADERRELSQKEKARIERIGGASTSFYSPRKERALKIYLEK